MRVGVSGRTKSVVSTVTVVSGSSALGAREDPEGSFDASESGVRGESGEVGGGVVGLGVCGIIGCDEGGSSDVGSARGSWPNARAEDTCSPGSVEMRRTGEGLEGDGGMWLKSITGADGQMGTD